MAKAIIHEITDSTPWTVPDLWSGLTVQVSGGSVTVEDADSNTTTLNDGDKLSYGSPSGAKRFEPWTFTGDGSATAIIIYNE